MGRKLYNHTFKIWRKQIFKLPTLRNTLWANIFEIPCATLNSGKPCPRIFIVCAEMKNIIFNNNIGEKG